jgi:hypothetical protein
MLDYFAIFHKGGALLWTLPLTAALQHNPLDALNALIRLVCACVRVCMHAG